MWVKRHYRLATFNFLEIFIHYALNLAGYFLIIYDCFRNQHYPYNK